MVFLQLDKCKVVMEGIALKMMLVCWLRYISFSHIGTV